MFKIKNKKFISNPEKGLVIAIIENQYGMFYRGKAKCNFTDGDSFDIDRGQKLAYFRAKQKMYNSFKKEIIRVREDHTKNYNHFMDMTSKDLEKTDNVLNALTNAIAELSE